MTLVEALQASVTWTDYDARGDSMLETVLAWKRAEPGKYELLCRLAKVSAPAGADLVQGPEGYKFLRPGARPYQLWQLLRERAHEPRELRRFLSCSQNTLIGAVQKLRAHGVAVAYERSTKRTDGVYRLKEESV